MRRHYLQILLIIVVGTVGLLVYAASSSAQDVDNNNCVICHSDYWEMMEDSIHSRHQITCNQCHGGDPTADSMEAAKAPGTGFIGVPDKVQIAQKCGSCHADVEYMNFYNLRTDQLARFKTSAHGRLLFQKGDERAATCSDCHDYHDVVAVDNPSSPVYPTNVPKTCNRCHGKEKIMAPFGHPTDIFDEYKNSVHGKALYEKGDISVANCAKCHGSHGAVPPGVKQVSSTCGKCHINEKKFFLESEHAKATQRGEFNECISCHGYHGVQKAGLHIYKEKCGQCHTAESDAIKNARQMLNMLGEAELRYELAHEKVRQAAIDGIFVEREEADLEAVKTDVIEMAPMQHSLLLDKIKRKYETVAIASSVIERSIQKKRKNLRWRILALIPIWIFVIIMARAQYLMFKHIRRLRKMQYHKSSKNKQDKDSHERS